MISLIFRISLLKSAPLYLLHQDTGILYKRG